MKSYQGMGKDWQDWTHTLSDRSKKHSLELRICAKTIRIPAKYFFILLLPVYYYISKYVIIYYYYISILVYKINGKFILYPIKVPSQSRFAMKVGYFYCFTSQFVELTASIDHVGQTLGL